jgi:hypothetical protein
MNTITPHKGGRDKALSLRLTAAELAAVNAARGRESVTDWAARIAALPTSAGQRVKVIITSHGGESTTAEGEVSSADGRLVIYTHAGQRVEIELVPDTILPPPPATHFVVTGGLIFAAENETRARTIAAMDANARIFTEKEDAEKWLKTATNEVAPAAEPFAKTIDMLRVKGEDEITPPGEWNRGR